MVNESGQLYTIEGVAAAMIMLVTAYIVLGSTSVYTPGDSHISDMQLEQLGTDALRMMNTPVNSTATSTLQTFIQNNDSVNFTPVFLHYCNNETGSQLDNLQFSASVSYVNQADNTVGSYLVNKTRDLTGGEHPVRVTEWVMVDKTLAGSSVKENRTVLVEVLLWRD